MGRQSPVSIRGAGSRPRGHLASLLLRVLLIAALLTGWLGLAQNSVLAAPSSLLAQAGFSPTQVVDVNVGISNGAAAWGDFNNDGNLDLLVSGLGYAGTNLTRTTLFLYNADKATLEPIDLGLPRLEASSIAWGDYDNDGYLDLLLTGKAGSSGFAAVYHNVPHTPDAQNPSNRAFQLVQQLGPIYQGAGVWGDYDNDGRLDILISGYTGLNAPFTRLYHNDGATFSEVAAPVLDNGASQPLTALGNSAAAWFDYDRDGYADLAITGRAAGGIPTTLIYHNNRAGGFDRPINLPGLWEGTVNWIDYAGNGQPGLLLTGNAGTNNSTDILPTTRLYRVDLSQTQPFIEVPNTGLPNVWSSSVSVGDFNNDGYPDIALNGLTASEAPTDVYINQHNGTFLPANAALPHSSGLSVAWGDFNGDKSLDLAVTGIIESGVYHTKVFINDTPAPARTLTAPAPRAACWDGTSKLILMWTPASSSPTPATALTYNVRAGAAAGGAELLAPSSDLASGEHRLPMPGNVGTRNFSILTGLTPGQTYHWAVQAEDASYLGGPFSTDMSIPYGKVIAVDDKASTVPNTPVSVAVLQNDNQTGFGPLAVYSVGAPAHGKAAINPDGTITYTPDSNFVGQDSFAYYAISQPSLYCTSARVTVDVVHADKYPPTDISLSNASVTEGAVGATVGVFSTTDGDNPLDAFTYTLVTNGCPQYTNDLFTIQGSTLRTAAALDHRTNGGKYLIHVRVTDHGGNAFEKDFTIQALASPPSLAWLDASGVAHSGAAAVTMSQDGVPVPFKVSLLANDAGTNEQLTWSILNPPAHGQASAGGGTLPGQPKLDIGYLPALDWTGQDCFIVRVTDPYGNTADITINVTVTPGNQTPTLDPIPDQSYPELSGWQVIELSGISPGAGESGTQTVTLSVDPQLAGSSIHAAEIVYPLNGDATRAQLRLQIGAGAGAYPVAVVVDDHQAVRSLFVQKFTVTVTPGPHIYLPLVGRAAAQP